MTFDIMTFNRTMSSITTHTIKSLLATVDKSNIQQNDTQCDNSLYWVALCCASHFIYCYADCYNAEYHAKCCHTKCHFAECLNAKCCGTNFRCRFENKPTPFVISATTLSITTLGTMTLGITVKMPHLLLKLLARLTW